MIKEILVDSGMFQATMQLVNGKEHNYSLSRQEEAVMEISINTSSDYVKVIVSKCWATSTPNPADGYSYTFLENRSYFTCCLCLSIPSTTYIIIMTSSKWPQPFSSPVDIQSRLFHTVNVVKWTSKAPSLTHYKLQVCSNKDVSYWSIIVKIAKQPVETRDKVSTLVWMILTMAIYNKLISADNFRGAGRRMPSVKAGRSTTYFSYKIN